MGDKTLSRRLSGQNLAVSVINLIHENIQARFEFFTAHKGTATKLLPTRCPPVLPARSIFEFSDAN